MAAAGCQTFSAVLTIPKNVSLSYVIIVVGVCDAEALELG